ncbi:MAG: hypothetical protein ACOVP1_14205 [Bacteroidia bacterium]
MRTFLLSFVYFTCLFFISCGSESGAGLGVIPHDIPSNKNDSGFIPNTYKVVTFEKFVEKPILAKVWVDTSVYFHFSNENDKDKFRIKIVGDQYYDAMIYFWVTQKNKNLLFTDSFPLIDALSIALEGGGHYGTDSQKERFVRKYVDNFLDPENISGAIMDESANLVEEYKVHPNFENLIADSAYKTFTYSKRKNSETLISFSPVQQHAMIYYEY